jgi:hypothetical protein
MHATREQLKSLKDPQKTRRFSENAERAGSGPSHGLILLIRDNDSSGSTGIGYTVTKKTDKSAVAPQPHQAPSAGGRR